MVIRPRFSIGLNSPYIAAFFAFRSLTNSVVEIKSSREKKVRIFIFDQQQWHRDYSRIAFLNVPGANFFDVRIYGDG